MTPIRVLLADDEAPARAKVRRLLRPHRDLELVGEAATGTETLEQVRSTRPDLLLLDVQMPPPDGLEVARRVHHETELIPHVVFLTAHDAYAVQAFEVNAVDYLIKPFDRARFDDAMDRARELVAGRPEDSAQRLVRMLEALDSAPPYLDRILVRDGQKSVLIRTVDVDWVEAAQNYVILHAGGASYMIRGTLQELESRLDPRQFIRIHRSTLVNLDRVKALHPWSHGDFEVVLVDATRLRLSRRYRDRLPVLGAG